MEIKMTSSLNTAAVLLTKSFVMTGTKFCDALHRRIEFQFEVPDERDDELQDILDRCEAEYDIDVRLGEYESNRNMLRDMITAATGGENGRKRG